MLNFIMLISFDHSHKGTASENIKKIPSRPINLGLFCLDIIYHTKLTAFLAK